MSFFSLFQRTPKRRRATRSYAGTVPALECLEDRRLLATLQISGAGGIGSSASGGFDLGPVTVSSLDTPTLTQTQRSNEFEPIVTQFKPGGTVSNEKAGQRILSFSGTGLVDIRSPAFTESFSMGTTDKISSREFGAPLQFRIAPEVGEKIGDGVNVKLAPYTFASAGAETSCQITYEGAVVYQKRQFNFVSGSWILQGNSGSRGVGGGIDFVAHIGDTFTIQMLVKGTCTVQPANRFDVHVSTRLVAVITPLYVGDVDLTCEIDGQLVPSQAKDLHLKHIFGGEHVDCGTVILQNVGTSPATGTVTVSLYLSPTPNLDSSTSAILLGRQDIKVHLGKQASVRVPFSDQVILESRLTVGKKYHLVAEVTSKTIVEPAGREDNNSDGTATKYEFLGTPAYPKAFENGTYFNLIRNTLKTPEVLAAKQVDKKVDVADPMSFIAAFEGTVRYAYQDTSEAKVPTIGVGINLNTVDGKTKKDLAEAVRKHYKKSLKELSDDAAIDLLRDQAKTGDRKKGNSDLNHFVLTVAQNKQIFQDAYDQHAEIARKSLGSKTWDKLSVKEKTALVDLVYNTGGSVNTFPYPKLKAALQKSTPDFVLAGFQLIDSQDMSNALNKPKSLGGLKTRLEARFQNLLDAHKADLGEIVPTGTPGLP